MNLRGKNKIISSDANIKFICQLCEAETLVLYYDRVCTKCYEKLRKKYDITNNNIDDIVMEEIMK